MFDWRLPLLFQTNEIVRQSTEFKHLSALALDSTIWAYIRIFMRFSFV